MPAQSIFRCSHFILISAYVILTLSNNFVVGNINQPTTPTNDSTNHTGNDAEHEDHGIHIVSWRFSEISGPIIISIFMLAVSILKVSKYHEPMVFFKRISHFCHEINVLSTIHRNEYLSFTEECMRHIRNNGLEIRINKQVHFQVRRLRSCDLCHVTKLAYDDDGILSDFTSISFLRLSLGCFVIPNQGSLILPQFCILIIDFFLLLTLHTYYRLFSAFD